MPEIKIPNALLRLAWTGKIREKPCTHLDQIQEVEARADVCEACAQLGVSWVHLRMCMICGNIGCCSSSKNNHALQHYQETGHPLIKPYKQSGMEWIWSTRRMRCSNPVDGAEAHINERELRQAF